MALTKEQEAIYYAAEKADKNFQEELVRLYGKKAGDMRYRPKLWTDRKLKAAALRARRATDRWLKVMKSVGSVRRSNPDKRPDYADQQHFKKWTEGRRLRLDTRRAMWKLFSSDPEYWGGRGWTAVQDEVEKTMGKDRDRNPGPRSVHTAKWDDCVKHVKEKGTAADPYAVCTAAMGELAVRKPHRRTANPLPKVTAVRRMYYAVTASKGRERLYLKRSGKLTRAASGAARFSSVNEAIERAKAHLKKYPASRGYKFDVALAY